MDTILAGKCAVVTGSSGGIGRAIALELARQGASVIITGRDSEKVGSAVDETRRVAIPSAHIDGLVFDLTDPQAPEMIQHQFGEIDILVNNLGIYEEKQFESITDTEWHNMFEVNVLSGVRLTRQFLSPMLKRNWGRIIFISSEAAISVPYEMIHYASSKISQLAVARGVSELTSGSAVTVNSLLVGPTRTEGTQKYVADIAAKQKVNAERFEKLFFSAVRPNSLIKRFIHPEEVAHVVAFLASPRSSAINGAAIRVDGGLIRSSV